MLGDNTTPAWINYRRAARDRIGKGISKLSHEIPETAVLIACRSGCQAAARIAEAHVPSLGLVERHSLGLLPFC
jgi:hypothetical protein